MQKIILISGFGGSGKSTCAQLLWDSFENVAIVEADHLFRIKPFKMDTGEERERMGQVKLQNSLAVTKIFLQEDIQNVILEGLVWSQHELDAVVELVKDHDAQVWCFWLETSKEVRHKRTISRGRDTADSQAFLDVVEEKISDPSPLSLPDGYYHEIQTDHLKAKEVVEAMTAFLNDAHSARKTG